MNEKSLMKSSRSFDIAAIANAAAAGRKTIRLRMTCGMAKPSMQISNWQYQIENIKYQTFDRSIHRMLSVLQFDI
jgi:hypothetical protein